MKNRLFGLLLVLAIVGLTGCGSKGDSRFNYAIDELNTAVDESLERNTDKKTSVVRIEERLSQNIASSRIIACGDKEFDKNVDLTATSYQRNLDGYDGEIITSTTKFLKDTNVNYCLVYVANTRGYINVLVSYEKIDSDNYKPVFSIPKLLSGD